MPTNNSDLERYTQTIVNTIIKTFWSSCCLRLVQDKGRSSTWWCPTLDQLGTLARKNFKKLECQCEPSPYTKSTSDYTKRSSDKNEEMHEENIARKSKTFYKHQNSNNFLQKTLTGTSVYSKTRMVTTLSTLKRNRFLWFHCHGSG